VKTKGGKEEKKEGVKAKVERKVFSQGFYRR
jgi:hypothetical protein